MIGFDLPESLGGVIGFIGIGGAVVAASLTAVVKTRLGASIHEQIERRWRAPNRHRAGEVIQEKMIIAIAPVSAAVERMRCENAEQHAEVAAELHELARRTTRIEDHIINQATRSTS